MNEIELLVANIEGSTRYETLNGREYIVAPLSMIVPGVLNGSQGKGYYPLSEIKESTDAWNNMPIVVNHPTNSKGKGISARNPKVLEATGIGTVFNATTDDKLVAEGWFDIEKTKAVDSRIYDKLVANEPFELSTGLTLKKQKRQGLTTNKQKYDWIGTGYKPDHLAVLPDKKGACSVEDGCGVLVNEEGETKPVTNKLSFDDIRSRLAKAVSDELNIGIPTGASRNYAWVADVYSNEFIYETDGKLFSRSYSVDKKTDVITLGDDSTPVRRKSGYEAVSNGEGCGCQECKDKSKKKKASKMKLREITENAAKKKSGKSGANCGIGPNGFSSGNSCAKGSGRAGKGKAVTARKGKVARAKPASAKKAPTKKAPTKKAAPKSDADLMKLYRKDRAMGGEASFKEFKEAMGIKPTKKAPTKKAAPGNPYKPGSQASMAYASKKALEKAGVKKAGTSVRAPEEKGKDPYVTIGGQRVLKGSPAEKMMKTRSEMNKLDQKQAKAGGKTTKKDSARRAELSQETVAQVKDQKSREAKLKARATVSKIKSITQKAFESLSEESKMGKSMVPASSAQRKSWNPALGVSTKLKDSEIRIRKLTADKIRESRKPKSSAATKAPGKVKTLKVNKTTKATAKDWKRAQPVAGRMLKPGDTVIGAMGTKKKVVSVQKAKQPWYNIVSYSDGSRGGGHEENMYEKLPKKNVGFKKLKIRKLT